MNYGLMISTVLFGTMSVFFVVEPVSSAQILRFELHRNHLFAASFAASSGIAVVYLESTNERFAPPLPTHLFFVRLAYTGAFLTLVALIVGFIDGPRRRATTQGKESYLFAAPNDGTKFGRMLPYRVLATSLTLVYVASCTTDFPFPLSMISFVMAMCHFFFAGEYKSAEWALRHFQLHMVGTVVLGLIAAMTDDIVGVISQAFYLCIVFPLVGRGLCKWHRFLHSHPEAASSVHDLALMASGVLPGMLLLASDTFGCFSSDGSDFASCSNRYFANNTAQLHLFMASVAGFFFTRSWGLRTSEASCLLLEISFPWKSVGLSLYTRIHTHPLCLCTTRG